MTTITCHNCNTTITHNPQHITGCNCDPDAPHWTYIDKQGNPKGWSQAKYTQHNPTTPNNPQKHPQTNPTTTPQTP